MLRVLLNMNDTHITSEEHCEALFNELAENLINNPDYDYYLNRGIWYSDEAACLFVGYTPVESDEGEYWYSELDWEHIAFFSDLDVVVVIKQILEELNRDAENGKIHYYWCEKNEDGKILKFSTTPEHFISWSRTKNHTLTEKLMFAMGKSGKKY